MYAAKQVRNGINLQSFQQRNNTRVNLMLSCGYRRVNWVQLKRSCCGAVNVWCPLCDVAPTLSHVLIDIADVHSNKSSSVPYNLLSRKSSTNFRSGQ